MQFNWFSYFVGIQFTVGFLFVSSTEISEFRPGKRRGRGSKTSEWDGCPHLGTFSNGRMVLRRNYNGEVTLLFSCNENYTLVGQNVILTECIEGTRYFDYKDVPRCQKRCAPPPYLEHGEVELDKKSDDAYSPHNTYAEGTEAMYRCKDDYVLEPVTNTSNSSIRQCHNGVWTGVDLYCKTTDEQLLCSNPPTIENGFLQRSLSPEYAYISIPIGREVVYECEDGYKLVGAEKITCTNQGVWSPNPPQCHKEASKQKNYVLIASLKISDWDKKGNIERHNK